MPESGCPRRQGAMSPAVGALRTSTSASLLYVAAAGRFAAEAAALDVPRAVLRIDGSALAEVAPRLMDTALASVLMSSFAIEALLNEIYLAGALGVAQNFPGLTDAAARQLSDAWNAGAHKLSPREKADLAMVVMGVSAIDWGASAAQRFALLTELRNELVHHKPEWNDHGRPAPESSDKLERKLQSQFETAAIWKGRGAAFRWTGCMGAGCARWADVTATGFAGVLAERLGITISWATVRP
ncbi:MAG: hypothetical protein AB7U95_00350 [Reyranella sp.]